MKPLSILGLAYDYFDQFWKNMQQTMFRLSRHESIESVLYVEPDCWLSRLATSPRAELDRLGSKTWMRSIRGQVVQRDPDLWLHTPLHAIPFAGRSQRFQRWNRQLLLKRLNQAMTTASLDSPVVWVNRPVSDWFLDSIKPRSSLVFNWTDDWSAFCRTEEEKARTVESMESLTRQADLVLAVSPELTQQAKQINDNSFALPNATDVDHFAKSMSPDTPIAEELKDLPGPILGFVGFVTSRLDYPALVRLSQKRSDWSFVIVGPVVGTDGEESEFFSLPNVHALGARPFESLPQYIKGFDVGLIPYRDNELSNVADAIKLYDYLAAGLPVVSTRTAGADRLKDWVSVVDHIADFDQAALQEIESNTPEKAQSRFKAMQPHSWQARAEEVVQRLLALS